MAIIPGTERTLEAAQHWKQTFLLNRRGVLEDNEYTSETFDELKRRLVDNPIKGGDANFFEKIKKQMEKRFTRSVQIVERDFMDTPPYRECKKDEARHQTAPVSKECAKSFEPCTAGGLIVVRPEALM